MKEGNTTTKTTENNTPVEVEPAEETNTIKYPKLFRRTIIEWILILIMIVYIFNRDTVLEFLEPSNGYESLADGLSHAFIILGLEGIYLFYTFIINPILIISAKLKKE